VQKKKTPHTRAVFILCLILQIEYSAPCRLRFYKCRKNSKRIPWSRRGFSIYHG